MKETVLLQSYLQHIPSSPEAHDHPSTRRPCLALSPTKCDVPSVERWPRYYPGKLPKLQLQQLHPLIEFRCSQVHLLGSPVKSHHPSCSSRSKNPLAQNSKLENNASDNTSLMRYLKNTSSRGMVINPTRELTIDAYPDAMEVTSKKLCRCVWLVTSVD